MLSLHVVMILMESPDGPWNDNSTEGPENPDVTEIKPRYVWIDAAANFPDYANNKENISTDMVKVKKRRVY